MDNLFKDGNSHNIAGKETVETLCHSSEDEYLNLISYRVVFFYLYSNEIEPKSLNFFLFL